MNYCYKTQNPIASYGEERVAKMKEVSKKYDPSALEVSSKDRCQVALSLKETSDLLMWEGAGERKDSSLHLRRER